tara:strand:+ start:1299 stop:2165 length:867 start_codon:yes stop_codon:yes gene_type:complete
MEKNDLLDSLIAMSLEVGKEVAYVQGGGGNTSVKLSSSQMAIKASGINLKEMCKDSGYSIVDYVALNNYLKAGDVPEESFSKKINSFRLETDNRPSIETGFHSYLGKFVIHTHSVFANILNCSFEGREYINSLFPNAILIDYATPGRDLTLEIMRKMNFSSMPEGVIFLQNHGVIAWAESSINAIRIHKDISDKIIKEFDLGSFLFDSKKLFTIDKDPTKILFPDQAVFTLAGDEILKSASAQETICSYNYILNSIESLGFSPMFLSEKESLKLINMESEKFRQALIQ